MQNERRARHVSGVAGAARPPRQERERSEMLSLPPEIYTNARGGKVGSQGRFPPPDAPGGAWGTAQESPCWAGLRGGHNAPARLAKRVRPGGLGARQA